MILLVSIKMCVTILVVWDVITLLVNVELKLEFPVRICEALYITITTYTSTYLIYSMIAI